jgi:hypothetical protein
MAEQHLRDLEHALAQRGWDATDMDATPGSDDWGISGTWAISRGHHRIWLDFDGRDADGLITYPMGRAFACHVRGHPEIEIWFRKRSAKSSWRADLESFVASLDALSQD